jgi:hypothetical protein
MSGFLQRALQLSALLLPWISATVLFGQPSSVKDCEGVLRAKDYYSYAQKNNLEIDFLRSIDSETWQQMKTSNDVNLLGVFSGGLFSLSDDYNTFNEKRIHYLESVHYNRTESQAVNILEITSAPRAYDAYSNCLQHIVQPGLIAWAAKEDPNHIELHVKYVNPAGVAHMVLEGLVSGGSVAGAPKGHLWRDGTKWTVMQEKVFTIDRAAGTPETTVIVAPADGSTPFTKTFFRADGTLELSYVGTNDVLRLKDHRATAHSPNNNQNKGHCPNEVGHADGKWCQSKTSVQMSTTGAHFLQNARITCAGFGCPWTGDGHAAVSADGLSATGSLVNWGWDVDVILLADEYEHMTKTQCGGDGPIPVILGQTVIFTAISDCLPIATISWKSLTNGSAGVVNFGKSTKDTDSVSLESTLTSGNALIGSYKLVR